MKRITPRTCLWPLTGVLCATFALSIGLTYQSNHHCYAGTCGEWLFPLQARLHVVVWYMWISLSVAALGLRAFQPRIHNLISKSTGFRVPLLGKHLRAGGLLLVLWVCILYGVLINIWWMRLRTYFQERGRGLPGNNIVAAVALTGHLADVTMGMVLLPVSRHSALSSFFKLSPNTTYTFHMVLASLLLGLVVVHGSLYVSWAALYNLSRDSFRHVLPVLNPTYLYEEVWPGNTSALGTWRASLIFTGITSSLIILALFLTSFPIVRKSHFNVFYFTHLLGVVAVVVICLHASTMFYCTIPGLSMWLLDWGMRGLELREKLESRLQAVGNGWYSLTMPLPRKRLSGCSCHSPLAHFHIYHSESSILEIHPFTTITHLASTKSVVKDGEDFINIQFLFRKSMTSNTQLVPSQSALKTGTQWTNRLASLADEEKGEAKPGTNCTRAPSSRSKTSTGFSDSKSDSGVNTTLRLEGPYFTAANPQAYKTVVCLVAGTGLSGAIAIAAAFQAQNECLHLSLKESTSGIAPTCPTTALSSKHWERCVVIWSIRETDFVDMPFFDALKCERFEFRIHKTGGTRPRPDMRKELEQICGDDGRDSWCYISGPDGFISAAEQSCSHINGLKWFAAKWG